MNTLINRLIHIISNGNARCKSTNVRTTASISKEKRSRRGTKETGNKGIGGIQAENCTSKKSNRVVFSIKELCVAKRKNSPSSEPVKRKEGSTSKAYKVTKSLFSFISLNILYLDLLDTYPYYAIFCIKELYTQTFNNIGVHS